MTPTPTNNKPIGFNGSDQPASTRSASLEVNYDDKQLNGTMAAANECSVIFSRGHVTELCQRSGALIVEASYPLP